MRAHTGILVFLLGAAGAVPAGAASIVADAQTLGTNTAPHLPAAQQFTVSSAGQVQLRLRDTGTPLGTTPGFSDLRALVTRGATKVVTVSAAGGDQTVQFAAEPGTYKVQVVGTPATPAGSFDVDVQSVQGATELLHFADGMLAAAQAEDPAASDLDLTFAVSDPGDYVVTLTDRMFPAALADLGPLLQMPGGQFAVPAGACAGTTCTIAFHADAAGSYELLVPATAAAPDQAGLYSLSISGGPFSAVIHASTHAVGLLPAPVKVTLPAGGGLTLNLADFATPAALDTLNAIVIQGAGSLGGHLGTGSAALTTGSGEADLYVFRKAASDPGTGSYQVTITQGTTNPVTVFHDLRAVPDGFDATSGTGGYAYPFAMSAAGSVHVQLTDLAFPTSSFASLHGFIVQNGSVVQDQIPSGGADVSLVAGDAALLVLAKPAGDGNGLFGLTVGPAAGTALLSQAQGVGPLIGTHEVDIAAPGSYDLTVSDLAFPQSFLNLFAAFTQGPALIAQVFGSGKITFNAPSAGTYFVNLLAQPTTSAQYATWGFDVSATPAPTVTLSANPTSVASGSTTTLTWSSTNATGCTASGGWSGSKAVSGTETTAALTAAATFTLTCTNAGGSANQSVTVNLASSGGGNSSGGGGGGSLDLWLLALAALLLAARVRRVQLPSTRSRL